MKAYRFSTITLMLIAALSWTASTAAQPLNIEQILQSVNKGSANDRRVNNAREAEFRKRQKERQGALNGMINERKRQERISVQLENNFNINEDKIINLQEELKQELGDLKELFGVIQQTASEAQEEFKTSIISAQYPDRSDTLQQMVAKMAQLSQLVSINEIEELWFHLQNEMTEQGKVVQYQMPVIIEGDDTEESRTENRTITRIGVFNAVSGNDIARYEHNRGFVLLKDQMDSGYIEASNNLQSATQGVTSFQLDPTKGALLSALVKRPSLGDKIQEGKIIGFVILGLGALAVIVALVRIAMLTKVEADCKKQAQSDASGTGNPLGRLRASFSENPDLPVESMELVAMEAIQREAPALNRGVMLIKIIAVVAPLLGLLGTVTGMIQTFQAITLFGAGDPQMMAGGISQALVTTVLGLVVAIPAVFLHWLASSRAQSIEDLLEEHAAGLLAQRDQ